MDQVLSAITVAAAAAGIARPVCKVLVRRLELKHERYVFDVERHRDPEGSWVLPESVAPAWTGPDTRTMAKTTITQISDDLDGSKDAKTYSFAWRGTEYEIDLSNKNFKAFDKLLQPYIEAGTKVSKRSSGRRSSSSSSSSRDFSAIRGWAKSAGLNVSDRGRVPKSVIEQYDASH